MVSMEEIIALQKREFAAQKQKESGKGTDKGSSSNQGRLSKNVGQGKVKEKGITIKEHASQSQ